MRKYKAGLAPLTIICLSLVISLFSALGAEDRSSQPNVIVILADDVSAKEYPLYGGTVLTTPHLDSLAKRGVVFSTAWAAPVCGPSRAMLMSGLPVPSTTS